MTVTIYVQSGETINQALNRHLIETRERILAQLEDEITKGESGVYIEQNDIRDPNRAGDQ